MLLYLCSVISLDFIEKDLYIAIKVKLLEIFNPLKIQRAVPPAGHLVVTG